MDLPRTKALPSSHIPPAPGWRWPSCRQVLRTPDPRHRPGPPAGGGSGIIVGQAQAT